MSKKNTEKKPSSFVIMLKRLFGIHQKETQDIFTEEQVQSPMRTVVRNFMDNKLAMTALIVFLAIFLFVLIAPVFMPIDLSFQEGTQANIAPGRDMMKIPKELQGNIASIDGGSTFGVGADTNGKVYVWGKTKISERIDLKDIPEDMGKIVQVSAGVDHILALAEDGTVYSWGNDRLQQVRLPNDIYREGKIIQVEAGYQLSMAVTDEGYVHVWGNENINDVRVKRKQQGTISKVVASGDSVIGLTEDGEVVHLGRSESDIDKIPEDLENVVDIAACSTTGAAVTEDGEVVVWGNTQKGQGNVPEMDGKVVQISGGRYHFTALTDTGHVYSWGDNVYGQSEAPQTEGITNIYTGYYQNYAVDQDGNAQTWGLKGYLLGSDELGRDVFTRLVNGGRMTITIGAVAVIISTIIAVIVGGISGYCGGKVDIVLQRVMEVVSSIPFIPFAMILTVVVGNKVSETMRIFIIMLILGVLSWPTLSRLVRAQVLAERESEFVTAAKAMGVSRVSIIFRHIIPNVISVIIVTATIDFATCMLTEATLSWLGFGVKLPRPTWGNMLYGAADSVVIQSYWWRWVFPALLLSICVICINTIGDGLRDAIDPKSNDR